MNEDLILRNALSEKLQAHHDFFVNGWGGFSNLPIKDKVRVDEITNCIAEVMNAPAVDAVEVVRCRDCKFGDWDSEPNDAMVCMRTKDGFWRSGNDFCSFGKRKDGSD